MEERQIKKLGFEYVRNSEIGNTLSQMRPIGNAKFRDTVVFGTSIMLNL